MMSPGAAGVVEISSAASLAIAIPTTPTFAKISTAARGIARISGASTRGLKWDATIRAHAKKLRSRKLHVTNSEHVSKIFMLLY